MFITLTHHEGHLVHINSSKILFFNRKEGNNLTLIQLQSRNTFLVLETPAEIEEMLRNL